MRALIIVFVCIVMQLVKDPLRAQADDDLLMMLPALLAKQISTPSSAKPGPENTGPKGSLIASGGLTIETDGAVVSDLDVDGCINIEASNITLRNIRINCSGFYGIRILSGSTNILIEDVEIFGMQSAGILGSDFVVRRANIHDSGNDAIKPGSNALIESSWFHKLGYKPEAHADGVQMVSGSNVVMRGNNFDMPYFLEGYRNSQCMIIQTNNGPIDDILIEGNWLNGGGYCVQINDKGRGFGPPSNVRIIDNKFGPDCNFGILRFRDSSPELSGNTYEQTGEPIGTDFTLCGDDF